MKKALVTFALLLAVSFLPGVSHADDSVPMCTQVLACVKKAGRIVLSPEYSSGECAATRAAICRNLDHRLLARKRAAARRNSRH